MQTFENLLSFSRGEYEQRYLRNFLEVMSPRERYALTAFMEKSEHPLNDAAQIINFVLDLPNYHVTRDAETVRDSGTESPDRKSAAVGDCIVSFPVSHPAETYTGEYQFFYEPMYDVRVKLASDACPEGVWIPFPDCSCQLDDASDEARIALGELRAARTQDCRVVDAVIRTNHGCNIPLFPKALDVLRGSDNPQSLVCDLTRDQSSTFWDEIVFSYPSICRNVLAQDAPGGTEIDLEDLLDLTKPENYQGLAGVFVWTELCQAVDWKRYAVNMLVDEEGFTWDSERKVFFRPDGPITWDYRFLDNIPALNNAGELGRDYAENTGPAPIHMPLASYVSVSRPILLGRLSQNLESKEMESRLVLRLPMKKTLIAKTFEKCGLDSSRGIRLHLETMDFPKAILDNIGAEHIVHPQDSFLQELNALCMALEKIDQLNRVKLAEVIPLAAPETIAQITWLAEHLDAFEYFICPKSPEAWAELSADLDDSGAVIAESYDYYKRLAEEMVQSGQMRFSRRGCVQCANLPEVRRKMRESDVGLVKKPIGKSLKKSGNRVRKNNKRKKLR